MTLTLQQALDQLDSVTSLEEIYALAAQVEVTGGGAGNQTILYSGGLSVNPETVGGIHTGAIAQSFADAIDQSTAVLEGGGRGVKRDIKKAKTLYRKAAQESGGRIWVYSPPVGGIPGRSIPLDTGPKIYGLPEAINRLEALEE